MDLTKNKLKVLPDSICDIKTLTFLNLSNNLLEALPSRFGDLVRLEKVWVEGNQLTQTPPSFGRLRCHCANLNANRFRDWALFRPELTLLTTLTLNLNHLEAFPDSLCTLPALTSLSASNNSLVSLPESFGALVKLRSLRLDWNRIKELPYSFRHLTVLEDIHMERNPMTMPPLEVVYQGAATVVTYMHQRYLAWLRQERRKVVEQLQAVLAAFRVELDLAMEGNDLPTWTPFLAVFTPDVERTVRGTSLSFYALVLPALLSDLLPCLQRHWANHPEHRPSESIVPFDFFDLPHRVLVDAVTNYDDEYSMALVGDQVANFRSCACVDPDTNTRKPCNRTPAPFQCERSDAALLRVKMVTSQEYKDMQSDSYLVARRERLANAMRAKCVEYINSEPGIEFFDKTSIKCAKTLLATRAAKERALKQKAKHDHEVATTRRKTILKIQALQTKHSRRSMALGKTMGGLQKELEMLQMQIRTAPPGQAKVLLGRRDELMKRIDQAQGDLHKLAQDPAMRKLQQKMLELDGKVLADSRSSVQTKKEPSRNSQGQEEADDDKDNSSDNTNDDDNSDNEDSEGGDSASDESDESDDETSNDDANSLMAGLGAIPGLEPVVNWIDAATAIIERILDTRQPPKKPHAEELAHLFNQHLRDTYTKEKMAKVKNKVTTEFHQMRFVLRKWMGFGNRVVYVAWRDYVRETVAIRRATLQKQKLDEELAEQNRVAEIELGKLEATYWDQKVNPYTDTEYYQHRTTGELRDTPPPYWEDIYEPATTTSPPLALPFLPPIK
ncbi:hypothetical protein, variant [Aphanomyces astaci]|nr:hypothetical protein, variant [Aphanomyces astaci]ETV88635.1 hypothetical protein, variant [Aphanomyces astaci]|eukprot:XP_009821035.1 hypothetical protein, variant [Aphanomyces astaci]